ncbi:MAG: DUF3732 domain-containing protein [Candidatus Manganitrophus sp.]|nr:DUF3732 domain-containing protein [Candidatus Manganitrophus sp.]
MKAKISKIILWPKNTNKTPRIVSFEMSGVEVITGKSQTGKSSLIPIIDYCLGSRKCAIPVGDIRNTVEWFGVLIRLPNSEMLIARRNPGLQSETNDMYFDMGSEVDIPSSLEGFDRVSTTAVLSKLNDLAELPSLTFTGEDGAGFGGRPSFRDMAAFQFQPQHIVANPYTLFFKADTFEHQEKLKYVFPLVLGAIDIETLEKRRELRTLETELKQLRSQLDERRERSKTWLQDFRVFYSQAREFGLLSNVPEPSNEWLTEAYVGYLSSVPQRLRQNPFPLIEQGSSRRLAYEIASLRNEEESLAKSINDRKRKLSRIERLRSATDDYSQALSVQNNRLKPLSWFSEHINRNSSCPVCGSATDSAAAEVQHLAELSREVTNNIGTVGSVHQVLDKEIATLSSELRKLEDSINRIREWIASLEQKSEQLRTNRQTLLDIYNFTGRLDQELKKFSESDQGNSVMEAVTQIERRIADVRALIDQSAVDRRVDVALDNISQSIRFYAEILGVEHAERPARIDIRNLTLAVESPEGRKDYLWEIGSASNWMGYHIATLLALHEHFLSVSESNGSSPVPQFLIIDQPSQAFFLSDGVLIRRTWGNRNLRWIPMI